jgi:signal transduction histidine kinase
LSLDLLGVIIVALMFLCLSAALAVPVSWYWRRRLSPRQPLRSDTDKARRMETFLRALPEGLFLSDREGRLLWCNSRARELLALDRTDFQLGGEVLTLVQRAAHSRQLEVHELSPASGARLQLRVLSQQQAGSDKHSVGGIVTDVAEQRHQEELYRHLIRNMWHELKTPLVIVSMHISKMRQLPNEDAETRAASLDVMESEVERLTNLTSNILLLSRLESEEPLHLEPVNIGALAEQEVISLLGLAEQKGIRVSIQSALQLPRIQADRGWLRQVFANLVGNAIKHCPSGTQVEVRLASENKDIAIEVADNGPGIPEDDLPHLFEKLYRIQKEGTRSTQGSGLGLSIVKKIVERHGGEITVKSKVDAGTTFVIRLPAGEGKLTN